MEIRFLKPDDAAEWRRLRLEALENDPEAFSADLEEYRALKIEEVKQRLFAHDDACVVGAFEAERLIGMAGFFREKGPKSRHKGRVWGVYVDSTARGRGIGRKIMSLLLERAMGIEGLEQVQLSVAVTQSAATALYRSLGFQLYGREPKALKVADRFIDEEYYVLPVNRKGR